MLLSNPPILKRLLDVSHHRMSHLCRSHSLIQIIRIRGHRSRVIRATTEQRTLIKDKIREPVHRCAFTVLLRVMGGVHFDVRSSVKVRYLLSAQPKGRLRDRVDQSVSCTRKEGFRVCLRGMFPEVSTELSRNVSNDSICATLLTCSDGLRSASVSLQYDRVRRTCVRG